MGLGRIIGGALQGAGAGIAEVGRSAEEERRSIALEKLRQSNAIELDDNRSSNSMAEATHSGVIDDTLNKNQTARQTDAATILESHKSNLNRVEANEERDWRGTQADKDRAHDSTMARLSSALRQSENAASQRLGAEIDKDLAAGTLDNVITDENGYLVKMYRDGRSVPTNIRPEPSGSSSGGGSALEQARGLGGGGASAPTPARAMSQADIAVTAREHGMSEAEAKRQLEALGYTLAN